MDDIRRRVVRCPWLLPREQELRLELELESGLVDLPLALMVSGGLSSQVVQTMELTSL